MRSAWEETVRSKLYPFQWETVRRLGRRALLCYEAGLGKTRTALAAAFRHLSSPHQRFRLLVVAPLSVVGFWAKEAEELLQGTGVEILIARNGVPMIPSDRDVIVITNPERLKYVVGIRWDGLILDESHLYKNADVRMAWKNGTRTAEYRTQRVELARRIARSEPCRFVWLLTATPDPNYNPMELVPQLDFIGALWTVFGGRSSFLQQYGVAVRQRVRGREVWRIEHWRGFQMGRERAFRLLEEKGMMERKSRKEAARWLPDVIRSVISIEMEKEEWEQYRQVRAQVIQDWEKEIQHLDPKTRKEVMERKMSAWAMVSISRMRKLLERFKARRALELWESIRGPTVWFVNYVEVAKELAALLKAPFIVGEVSERERDRAAQLFNSGKAPHIVVGIEAGGVGLSFPDAAAAVFIGMDWSPGVMEQAEGRVRRINRSVEGPPLIYHVQMTGPSGQKTADHHVAYVASRKELSAEERRRTIAHLILKEVAEEKARKL